MKLRRAYSAIHYLEVEHLIRESSWWLTVSVCLRLSASLSLSAVITGVKIDAAVGTGVNIDVVVNKGVNLDAAVDIGANIDVVLLFFASGFTFLPFSFPLWISAAFFSPISERWRRDFIICRRRRQRRR